MLSLASAMTTGMFRVPVCSFFMFILYKYGINKADLCYINPQTIFVPDCDSGVLSDSVHVLKVSLVFQLFVVFSVRLQVEV